MSANPPTPEPVIGLDAACDAVLNRLRDHLATRPIVGITGPVGSGKSTLATMIAAAVNGLVLSTDRYLPDYALVAAAERDEPRHSDLYRLASDLANIKAGSQANVPVWSFHDHRRTGEEYVRALGPVVCEGIMALHERVLPSLDLTVFVRASSETRWSRWESIETSGERGWGVEAARAHFDAVAEPTFASYADVYLAAAQIVVWND